MMATIRSVKHNGVWLTFCALCGVLGAMFFPATLENVRDSYDTTHPVWSGMYGDLDKLGAGNAILIIIQLVFSAVIMLLIDELLSKGYGIGNSGTK